MYIGDFPEDFATVTVMFTTHDGNGAPVAPNSAFEAADILIYKNGNAAQKSTTNGVTMTSPFDTITGLHCVVIDTSNDTGDGGFWVTGAQYTVVLSPDETVNSQAVAKVVGVFGIECAPVLRPTVAGRELDVTTTGGAGIDWGNVENATTAVNLSSTNIDTDQVVASVSGAVGSVTGAVGSVTGNVGGNVTGSVGSVAANGISASSLASDAGAEIADAVWDEDATGHQTQGTFGQAIGDPGSDSDTIWALVNTNLNATVSSRATQASVDTIDGIVDDILVDTAEIGAAGAGLTNINLPNQTMDIVGNITGNLSGSVGSVSGAVGSVTGNVGGNVTGSVGSVASGGITAASFAADAITASKLAADVTTELQAGLATASAVSTLQTSVDDLPTNAELATALGTADDAVLAQVALVKAVTDKLDDTLEDDGGTYRFTANALEEGPTGGSAPTAAQVADAVWDEARADHTTNGTFGQGAASVQGNVTGSVASVSGNVGGNVVGSVGSLATQAKADVNAEVDSAISDAGLAASLTTIAGYIDTEVAAIKAKTDLIPGTQDGYTFAESHLLIAAAILGKASGLGTPSAVFRALDDSKARISATVDASGNRTAVTLDAG